MLEPMRVGGMYVCHVKGCTLLEGVQEYDADEDIWA